MKKNKTHELGQRLFLTALILTVYMIGRNILLYSVDAGVYQLEELNSQNIMLSVIGGDRHQYTIFALGIMPHITSNLIMWIFMAIKGAKARSQISPQKVERITMTLMLIIAAVSAISRAEELAFTSSHIHIRILKIIAVSEMVTGAFVLYKMANLNRDHGIGGQSVIVLVNILDNLLSTISSYPWQQLQKPVILCLIMAVMILIMENIIICIPIQRVSIHNMYADKSYIAYKLDPIGIMPVMFAVPFFMIPRWVVNFLLLMDKDNQALQLIYEKLDLTNIVGAGIYLGIIFTMNILFSFIILTPSETAKLLQKTGDSIAAIYAGKKTKRYLRNKLLLLAFFSGVVLCLFMGFSLGLALMGEIPPNLALFPATGMILTGMLCPICREIKAYWKFDSYSFFC